MRKVRMDMYFLIFEILLIVGFFLCALGISLTHESYTWSETTEYRAFETIPIVRSGAKAAHVALGIVMMSVGFVLCASAIVVALKAP